MTLVFERYRRYKIPTGTPQWERQIHGVGKFCDFRRLKSPFFSETVRERPTVNGSLIGSHR